ncbi:Copper fist DNA-binding [Penicillium taxi]|uniref:Copper fist DNA-binding n=1 Tax=Penicillium taxi TaxID=168475 RepID=UPI00254593E6|nr:Copper fist DNA-binding [Penicillium taxi]KAJ5899488.1 Copper fist DNA-binding [Penicillium taxi]
MLIDGEKWACEACVRGHRVSSCHHSDRPLTHINKKGRPVSQCTHCRGLRKSRTTHVKCECGEKKKKSDSPDGHADNALHRCGCNNGQRCSCALKKEHHLDTVPETGLPPPQPAVPVELPRKPLLTTAKSESTLALTIFRDGHHKPTHKHNDMAHKCGMPYTIPRSHTIHHSADLSRRSVDHLPSLTQATYIQEPLSLPMELPSQSQTSHGSPNSTTASTEEITKTPLDHPFLEKFAPTLPITSMEKPVDGKPTSAPPTMDKFPLEQIISRVPPPLDVSSFNYSSSNSPITCMSFQDTYQEPYFSMSPDSELPIGSSAFGESSVDWSSFPLYSNPPAANSTQTPSYASFDYNSYPSGLPPPSSSGDISEVDEFGPLPSLGYAASSDMHDLHSVSEASDLDHLRLSTASSLVGLPQTQILSSQDLSSINIDDFLKSANESTAALEHQLQASMGIDQKPIPTQDGFNIPQTQDSVPIWPADLFDNGSTPPMDESYFRQIWAS